MVAGVADDLGPSMDRVRQDLVPRMGLMQDRTRRRGIPRPGGVAPRLLPVEMPVSHRAHFAVLVEGLDAVAHLVTLKTFVKGVRALEIPSLAHLEELTGFG